MKSNKVLFAAVLLGSISLVALTRTSAASETTQDISAGKATPPLSAGTEQMHGGSSPLATGKTGTMREGQSTKHAKGGAAKKKTPENPSTPAKESGSQPK